MTQAHLVYGETGEYADASRWNVAVFKSGIKANAFKNRLNKTLAELGALMPENGRVHLDVYYDKHDFIYDAMKRYDDNFQFDYTGTRYDIEHIDLDEGVVDVKGN